MLIIGLTGSIGAGKSTVGKMFAACGIPVYDADAAVHALYNKGAAVAPIEKRFPGVAVEGVIDREKLSSYVLGNADNLRELENIVHPLVHQAELDFLTSAYKLGRRMVVLEIPLLLETNRDQRCDLIVTTMVTEEIQRQRVMSRPGMSTEKFESILKKQMPMNEKKSRSHFLVDTNGHLDETAKHVDDIIRAIRPIPGYIYKKRQRSEGNS